MDKPSFKLVGAPCGHHGQYTFYKALRLTGQSEKIIAIGDFFFVRVWQDSELVSIGELQLLWTDRVSDQTLVSLRLYFLPENTPEGRNLHGEDEVLAINDKVVLRADDLLSWMTVGSAWRWGLRAVWRGACAPPADPRHTAPLHQSRLDFSDIDTEKNAIVVDTEAPGVVVFSYPRYCRYRALLSRLEGIQADWLRDSLVAALGGYSAPTNNTRILYCKDTFEYPELEGHEFVCNHLAPKLKGRPRGRRRRADAPRSDRSATDSPPAHNVHSSPMTPRRLSLRNGADKHSDDEDSSREDTPQDKAFLHQLQQFYRSRNEQFHGSYTLKDLSLRSLYSWVVSRGGYEAVCRHKLWRVLASDQPARARRHYERFLLPFENHERRNCTPYKINGKIDSEPIATIDVTDSPLREEEDTPKILRTPSPDKYANLDKKYDHTKLDFNRPSKFDLDKPYRIEQGPENMTKFDPSKFDPSKFDPSKFDPSKFDSSKFDPSKFDPSVDCETGEIKDELVVKNAEELNREFLESLPKEENKVKISVKPVEKLIEPNVAKFLDGVKIKDDVDLSIKGVQKLGEPVPLNGHTLPPTTDLQGSSRPARSSLRHVRVKPARHPPAGTPPTPLRPDSASSSPPPGAPAPPPSLPPPPPITNFGIHHPPPPSQHNSDDEIVEVPYKPKTPEIIDLDEYPESPQAVKKKKLEILKEGGLEVTPLPAQWPAIPPMINPPIMLNPAMQHQIMTQAQLFQMYNIIPQNYANGIQPPKVIQASSAFGTAGPEKTVYGNPKDPFMPPPHVLHGAPVKPLRLNVPPTQNPTDLLDLTCITKAESPSQKPAVEIVRLPTSQSPKLTAQNLTKNYTLVDGKAVVGSNLEITLVNKAQSPVKQKPPQKRSSNGKFMSAKTPTPPKEQPFIKYPSPSHSSVQKKPAINIPNYQLKEDNPNQLPTPSLQNAFKNQNIPQIMDLQKVGGPMASFMDPYMALYSSLAGSMDQRQLAMYRDLMANQFRSYPGLLNLGISNTPTTKN